MSNVCGRGRTQTYKSVLATVSYQLNYSPLKIHLFSRTDVAFFLLLLTYFLFMFNMEILKEHRTDSNHRRTEIFPTPSSTESTMLLYVLSAMCVTTYLKAMLTDGFCFPFLLVPQTTLHRGSLCFMANCLLPHLLITGWLLTIYSIA